MSDIPATFYIDKAINHAAAANMHPSDVTDAIGEKRELLARIVELEAERDKWEWVARDACRELAYETHVNPQSPLDYRLANWRPRED